MQEMRLEPKHHAISRCDLSEGRWHRNHATHTQEGQQLTERARFSAPDATKVSALAVIPRNRMLVCIRGVDVLSSEPVAEAAGTPCLHANTVGRVLLIDQ
jgi:hypothetical protein